MQQLLDYPRGTSAGLRRPPPQLQYVNPRIDRRAAKRGGHSLFTYRLQREEPTMRALAGAILCTGAMIGLGLTAIGFGTRYSSLMLKDSRGEFVKLPWRDMDPALVLIMAALMMMMLVGLGLTFLGLAYHHERRHRERLHLQTTHSLASGHNH
jgi:hypothetical protein